MVKILKKDLLIMVAAERNMRRLGRTTLTPQNVPSELVSEGFFKIEGNRVDLTSYGKELVKRYSEMREREGIEGKVLPIPVRRGFSFGEAIGVLAEQYAKKTQMHFSQTRRGWVSLEDIRRLWKITYKEMNVLVNRQVWITHWVKGRLSRGGLPPYILYVFGARSGSRAFGSKGVTHIREIVNPPMEYFK